VDHVSDQERDGREEQALWPAVDDDEPPADEETREVAEPPSAEPPSDPTTRVLRKWPDEPTDPPVSEATRAIPFPEPDGEPPGEATRVIQVLPVERPAPETQLIKAPGLTQPVTPPPPAQVTQVTRPVAAPPPANAPPWPPPEPPRAAPMRIGPEPAPAPAPPPPPRRRRGRRIALIVVAALILVAAAGAGAVFAVPGLSDRLGLTHAEPEIVIQPPPSPVRFAPALKAPGGQSAAPTAAGVQAALAGAVTPGLGTFTGVVLDGDNVLWEQGATTPLVPASTGKLLTAAAALLSLNHTEQLTTTVVAGKDPGSVVIIGGGDPTLSSLKAGAESVYPGAAHLSDLVTQVKAKVGAVQTVYVDLGRYAGDGLEKSWDGRDVAGGYIAPIVPAMLDGGRQDATKETSPRSPNPAKALADEFAARIGAKVPANAATTAPPNAQVLGEVRSAPVVELVDTLLQRSDNVLAETVAREVAKQAGEEASFAGASRATLKVLQQNGFDTAGTVMADGSGLSGQDRVPARLLASILAVAAGPDGADPRTAKLRPLLGGLPVAGGSGTLEDRYNTPGSAPGKGWVRAKTGTLATPLVSSLAGVVLDADGRLLVFAFMTNNAVTATARPALDTLAATLRNCGCH
jgi:D-alanyl-D-alanine carboxypeptidase/D-alanyl-D-alanine-endopeptidase (penicillin-binding protein 4)